MDSQHFENSTLSAPDHSSRCTSSTNIDPGPDSNTKVGDAVAGIDSSSQECVLYQPDPGHSDMLHTTKTEHVRSLDKPFQCSHCPMKFTNIYTFVFHRRAHRDERRFVCTICGKTFARQETQKNHERYHERLRRGMRFVCRGELSAQPARTWGCGRHFEKAAALARHFNSQGDFGRACIVSLLDKEVEKAEVFPSVLLTQYPVLKYFDLAYISAWQDAPTGGNSGLSSNDSGPESALHIDPSESLSISPVQIGAQTERPQKALPYYGSLSSLGSQDMPSPPLQNLQDPADILTLLPDRAKTSEDSDNSLLKTTSSGDELDCESFSRAIELSGHQTDSQGPSDSEGRSFYKLRHVSKDTTFAQERPWEKDGSGRFSDNPEGSLSPNESSSNSGSESGYNDTSEGSILNYSQRALISRLMDEICSSFFYLVSHRPQQRGQGGQGSRDSSSRSTEQTVTISTFLSESHGSRRKRSHKEGEDPEDEDDGKNKRPRNQNSDDGHSTRVCYFACPFHKFDASTYGSGNADPRVGLKYRSCGPPGWPNIGKLKEHLYRNHQTPIHCPRCWTIMKTEAALGEHARARDQCDVRPPPLRWIPREVCVKLKNRKKAFAGQTEEDSWRYIFGLLFPDCPNIPSPYYNDGIMLEEMTQRNSPTSNAIAAYEEYARAHLPRLFEEALETAVAEQTQPIEEGLRRSLAGMMRDCQTRLAQNFLRHRSSNMPSTGGTGVQAEVLPSFYIEPLSLAEDIASINPTQISTSASDRSQTHSDSGYASVDTSVNRNSSGLFADLRSQDDIGALHDSTSHEVDISGGSDFMPEFSDWTALMGNNQDNDFFGNALCDESM